MNKTAYFGLGCFWEPDISFGKLPGTKTEVGYSGGDTQNPTYHDLEGHTETVKVEYDPETTSYKDLLKHFWESHDPTQRFKTQYRSVIFYGDEEQKKMAEESKHEVEKKLGKEVVTAIEPMKTFTKAEEYHQKYLEKN